MTWHKFPFLIGGLSSQTSSPWLPGGLGNLTAYGVVHDAIDHGFLGFPFQTAGETAAQGARLLWRKERVRDVRGLVFRAIRELDAAVCAHCQEVTLYGELTSPRMSWPGVDTFTPRVDHNESALRRLPRHYGEAILEASQEFEEYSSQLNMIPLSNDWAVTRLTVGLLCCLNRMIGTDPTGSKTEKLYQRTLSVENVIGALQYQATTLYRKNGRRPCLYEIQVSDRTDDEPSDVRVVSWNECVPLVVMPTDTPGCTKYDTVDDAGDPPPHHHEKAALVGGYS